MGLDNARTRVLVLWENHSMLPGRRCETQDVWVPGQEVEFLCKYSESSGFSQGLSSLGYRTTRLGRASDSHRPLGLLLLCSSKHTDPEAVLWGWVSKLLWGPTHSAVGLAGSFTSAVFLTIHHSLQTRAATYPGGTPTLLPNWQRPKLVWVFKSHRFRECGTFLTPEGECEFILFFWPCGLWDLCSLTRAWAQATAVRAKER